MPATTFTLLKSKTNIVGLKNGSDLSAAIKIMKGMAILGGTDYVNEYIDSYRDSENFVSTMAEGVEVCQIRVAELPVRVFNRVVFL